MDSTERNKDINVKTVDATIPEQKLKRNKTRSDKTLFRGDGCFRKIEILLHVSHVSVINLLKKQPMKCEKRGKTGKTK